MSSKKQKKQDFSQIVTKEWASIKNFWSKLVHPKKEHLLASLRMQAIGIGLVGFVGYIIKLVHIPINNILVNKTG